MAKMNKAKYIAALFTLTDEYLLRYNEGSQTKARELLEAIRLDQRLKLRDKRDMMNWVSDLMLAVDKGDSEATARVQERVIALTNLYKKGLK